MTGTPASTHGANLDLASVLAVATRALEKAERALEEAKDGRRDAAMINTKLDQHLEWCKQMREEDHRDREKDRLDAQTWRTDLGKRLDRSDSLVIRFLTAIVAMLVGVVAFLLTHGGVKFG